MIGSQLGSYEILEEIGRGGMGRVYKARQPSLDRIVAVKVLLPQLAADEVFVERFLREARSIATLEHPGIVTIYDVGESDNTYYFAMQLLDGQPLDEILEEGKPMPLDSAVNVARQMARALKYAHANGILHRDVKPGNIILTQSGGAVLTDFGIAQAASDTRLTRTGTSIGSPEYMAPEQIEGKQLDLRADLYSLGVVFFQMLTGQVPYKGDSAVSIIYQHVKSPVPSARDVDPRIPENLDLIASTLMAKLPEERYDSADDVLAALDGKQVGPGIKTKSADAAASGVPRWAWGAGAVLAAALAGFLWLGRSAVQPAPEDIPTTAAAEEPGDGPEENLAATDDAAEPEGAEDHEATGTAQTPDDDQSSPATTQAAASPPPPPPAATAQKLRITSTPAGATIVLDGEALGAPTPAEVELMPETEYQLQIRLDGHEAAGWTFSLAELSDAQKSSGVLHFPLRSSVPPGALEVVAGYPVRIRVGSRTFSSNRVELPPGEHSVSISAPSVFHSESRRVRISSGETQRIGLPVATRINIAANPSRCRVKIDGQDAGYVPAEVQVTLGQHVFEFDWESLGKSLMLTRKVTPQTDRIFATAPR